jgi:tetratricopeptide (TPR) repeat protein
VVCLWTVLLIESIVYLVGMRESSDRSDVSRSAPRASALDTTRRIGTDGDGQSMPIDTPIRRSPLMNNDPNDDSFSEERFLSPPTLRANSWDEQSQSFDSEVDPSRPGSRPSSRTSLRDRRKQFDTTTPTLIDEEDEEDPYGYGRYDEEEMSELHEHEFPPQDESSIQHTPGASLFTSTSTTRTSASFDPEISLEDQSMRRRTPGASAMHQSLQGGAPPKSENEAVGFGFGFALSTPVGAEEQAKRDKVRIWESFTSHSATPSPTKDGRPTERDTPSRPPLAPAAVHAPATATIASQPQEARGPFSFTPWAQQSQSKSQSPTTGSSSQAEVRPGAFSPNILRLTEDIGNLLQEDEDDDYAFEIPSVFRGDGDDLSEFSGDWMGSYVIDSEATGQRFGKVNVPRPGTTLKDGKTRRRSNAAVQGGFLPNAQQPKPRRSGNEVFQFGKARDERASPQLLNFGGAFAPPTNNYTGTVMRPVASSGFSFGAASHSQGVGAFGASGTGPVGIHSQAFDSHQSSQTQGEQVDPFFQQNRYTSPSPVYGMYGAGSQSIQQSEMQATAREFVPMATRSAASPGDASPSTASPYPGQQRPQTAPLPYETSAEQGGWQSATSFGYGTNYSFGMQGPGHRGMTPSPQFLSWQQGEPGVYGGLAQGHMEAVHPSLPSSGSQQGAPSPASDLNRSDHLRSKKEGTKRGKRGKKKSKSDSTGSGKKAATTTKKKKDPPRPGSATLSQEGSEFLISASEDPGDIKRAELVESPSTRVAFKDFYRTFRSEERFSFQKAEECALQALDDGSLPESVHWRVYLELADLAKRSNRYVEARRLYQKVCQLQPYASQGWLEYSKLEEECGHVNRVTNILLAGLEYCELSENLLSRAVKHQEKMGNLDRARELLARLKHVGIDKVWRTVLEGALLETRTGNYSMARRVLKYLMHHVPWYGPLYLEAYRLERDQGNPADAFAVVERGLTAIPRYGPLWFGAFRLCEEEDMSRKEYHLPTTMRMIERATAGISKELVWKVHLEAAQMLERAALEQASENGPSLDNLLSPARNRIAMTVLTCPNNLRWKVWLAAARMELGIGNTTRSRSLFLRAHRVVPEKGRSATLLECARLEEFIGDTDLSRAILCKGRVEYSHDWKVLLESVLLEIRCGEFKRAIEINSTALELHQGTGRLWSTLVQLSQVTGGDLAQNAALIQALNAVPKSGEVWCEGGRIHLNPFSDTFDLKRARRHLSFATRFTPQYGDSFIETLRCELLDQWLSPIAAYIWSKTKASFPPVKGSVEEDRLTKYITDVSLAVSIACQQESDSHSSHDLLNTAHRSIVPTVRKRLKPETFRKTIDLTDLRLACANADPNYGSLWFHCRRVSTDTPRRVIEDAAEDIVIELQKYARVYLAAMIRRTAVLSTMDKEPEVAEPNSADWEIRADEKLRAAPSLKEILNPMDPTTGLVLLESTMRGPDFVTGLTGLNKHRPIKDMSLSDRRKALFGTDALFP